MNTRTFFRFGALSAGLVLATVLMPSAAIAADGTVVYDNTVNRSDDWVSNLNPVSGRQMEIGDEISLAGRERIVTSFIFEYFGDIAPGISPGANAVLRFYANDGPLHTGVPMPKSLLWESDPITFKDNASQAINGFFEVTVPVPDITVPTKITWSIQFNGISGTAGSQAGLSISDPVTVGAVLPTSNGSIVLGSYSDYWGKTDPLRADSWALFVITPKMANFTAKVVAVPEPGTLALFAAGGIAALVRRRRVV